MPLLILTRLARLPLASLIPPPSSMAFALVPPAPATLRLRIPDALLLLPSRSYNYLWSFISTLRPLQGWRAPSAPLDGPPTTGLR